MSQKSSPLLFLIKSDRIISVMYLHFASNVPGVTVALYYWDMYTTL